MSTETKKQEEPQILDHPNENSIPTIHLQSDRPPQGDGGDDANILNIDFDNQIPTIIKIALLQIINLEQDQTVPKQESYLEGLINKLNSTINDRAVIGNLIEELEITIPECKIKDALNKPYMNELQYPIELSEAETQEFKNQIIKELKSKEEYINWKFIFSHIDLYNELEAQLRRDIETNSHEMVIVGHTIIVSKHFLEYDQIKNQISPEKVIESFQYHGTRLTNHPKIARSHFIMPGEDIQYGLTDPGYYGQGINTIDDIFYTSLYSNRNKILEINEKTHIICCKTIYNKDKEKDVYKKGSFSTALPYLGKKIDDDIKNNFGVHRVLVGNENQFLPITPDEIDQNEIYGNEYVYPNKYQVIPCLSFTVLRKDHYILYNDENLNNDETLQFMNEILANTEVNVYRKSNVDDAVDLIRKKKYAAVKLITYAGSDLSSRDLIIHSREIIGSNFVCLVFSPNGNNIDWISEMENVLLTTDYEDIKKFASLKMNINDLLAFIQDLRNKYEKNGFHFKINENELLLFPKCMEKCQYYQSYYDSNNDGKVKTFFKKIFSFFG